MPNWCEGNIRLRGKRESIVNFLKNELLYTGYPRGLTCETETGPLNVDDDGCEIAVSIPKEKQGFAFSCLYIKDTHRNFIDQKSFEVYGDNEEITVCIDFFKAAWAIEPEPYIEKANKYGIDIRIVGFERGMQFMQNIEIVNGKMVKNEEIEFEDWKWQCLMPNMGG